MFYHLLQINIFSALENISLNHFPKRLSLATRSLLNLKFTVRWQNVRIISSCMEQPFEKVPAALYGREMRVL